MNFSQRKIMWATTAVVVIAVVFAGYTVLRPGGFETGAPLLATRAVEGRIALINDDLSVKNLPEGWVHRTFFRVTPTDYVLAQEDGRQALHCATDNSGSILGRDTAINIADFPILEWDWKIETPLVSDLDEESHEGDDHPARFFVVFEDSTESRRAAEIIWSNVRFAPGDYKIIDGFHHLVANGLNENIGIWHSQRVDLEALYHKLTGDDSAGTLKVLGFFCDSDNTGGKTSAFFSNVYLSARTE